MTAFISYSWDSDEHRDWVLALATRLRSDGVETVLDQWHLVPGDQLPAFMEKAVRESDYVLIVCTPRYKERSERRVGGVGYEGDIITGEVLTTGNQRKFIPLLRLGEWGQSAPSWLAGKYHVDLRGHPYGEARYQDLITTLLGTRPQAPPTGPAVGRPTPSAARGGGVAAQSSSEPQTFEPIRIARVIVDKVGAPRNDGTRGSALYAVPFRFSRRPPSDWAQLFLEAWDRPPRFTSMHRPGIARIYGDKVVLGGTTVDEVERYHRETLILAAEEANKAYVELQTRRRAEEERERARADAHKKSVEGAAKRLKF
ncbi:MAG: toll/interleukin-1 receptor domain-containing protein [Acidobacteriota bacterium]|nr:toll/interleukin-1 receptor domain-containing protein [Acidobacteriota bacterium]